MRVPDLFDKKLLVRRRARAAARGDMPAFLLERAVEDMTDRLRGVQRTFSRALILGAYDGTLSRAIAGIQAEDGLTVSMDRCSPLLARCPLPLVRADEEWLPFAGGAFDLIASALSLQFTNDLPGALIQIRRALKPDGLFLCSVLGGATLQELRAAFAQAESELDGGLSPRISPMADLRDYGGLLQRAGFSLPVTDIDSVTVTYETPLALMHDLRAMGAGNVLSARRKTPLRRGTLQRAMDIYHDCYPAKGGRIKATFEIIHMSGWSPHESQQKPLQPGSAKARLADVLGVTEHRFNRG